jgi:GNAT superfamily N-acetyltransferase
VNGDVLRRAEGYDAAAVAELAGQLGYPSDEALMRVRLEAAQQCGTRDVIVAERDGRVRGWIEVMIIESLANDPFAEIHGLIVDEEERGLGLGAQLVAAAEAWAVERGLIRIRVRSNVARERTRKFYEKHGYTVTKTSNVFDKMLE